VSSWSVFGLVVAGIVAVSGTLVVAVMTLRRRSGADAAAGGEIDPLRRRVVQRGIITLFVAALAGVVAAAVDYVWPSVTGRTGGRFRVGAPSAIRARIAAAGGKPDFHLHGGFYLAEYPAADLAAARRAYPPGELGSLELGLVALSQKCPHLGCAVKWCRSSGWFECPCHGSRYSPVGELERGPSPRGLDRHPVRLVGGEVEVDTATTYLGPPPGTHTTDQPARGPHCY
jgi:cytochrome b6-f complex iron-sulfur subunit